MKKLFLAASLLGLLTLNKSEAQVVAQSGNIKVSVAPESPDFPEASLTANVVTKGDTAHVNFEVKNYTLGNQTADASTKRCANSAKGQHIHYIIDNGAYEALYLPSNKSVLKPGQHLLVAFLSRSYHESIKHPKAAIVQQINVGENNDAPINLKQSILTFSRPKGVYIGADTAHVMLDFYLFNTTLSKKGNKVRLSIDGKVIGYLDAWKPYWMDGLSMGEHTVRLELVDAKGNLIKGLYTDVTKKITLAVAEPLRK